MRESIDWDSLTVPSIVTMMGSTQADTGLKRQLRVLHLDPRTAGRESYWAWLGF